MDFSFSFYIELAANGLAGAGEGYEIAPPNPNRKFTIARAEIVVRDSATYQLYKDIEQLVDFVKVCRSACFTL